MVSRTGKGPPMGLTRGDVLVRGGEGLGSWASIADMPDPTRYLCAAAVASGKAYVCGGYNSSYLADVDEYNPVADTWASKADLTGFPRESLAAVSISDKIYVFGGYYSQVGEDRLKITDEYDPSGNSWTNKADMSAVSQSGCAAVVSNKAYYIAGDSPGYTGYSRQCEEYDPVANTWASKTDMPSPGRYALAATAISNKIYVFAGCQDTNTICSLTHEYDPSTNLWAAKADVPSPARNWHVAVAISGNAYLAGGQLYYGGGGGLMLDCDRYKQSSNSWRTKADMPTPYRAGASAATILGKMYVFAGYDDDIGDTLKSGICLTP